MSTIKKIPINATPPGWQKPRAGAPDASTGPQGPKGAAAEEAATKEPASGSAAGPGPGVAGAGGPGGPRVAGAPSHKGKAASPQPEEPTDTSIETDEAAQLMAERDVLKDSLLRLQAEFDNYRKRSSRELAESRQQAQAELLHDLLPVLDNLERALDAAEHHEENKVLGGVRMTRDMFVEQLRRGGVKEIETVGIPFDPSVHEAMAMQSSSEEEGVVSVVLQRGYRQGERVLRPARVVVSSGPGQANDTAADG